MDRLTKANVRVDPTAAKYIGDEVRVQDINDRLLDLILNGPTLYAVSKDKLRQIIRQLYRALKSYEDTGLEPEDLDLGLNAAVRKKAAAEYYGLSPDQLDRACELFYAEKEARQVVPDKAKTEPLTVEELRKTNGPVWCVCKPIEGGDGYWCLCCRGLIVTPSGSCYDIAEIPHWVFLREAALRKEGAGYGTIDDPTAD